MNCMLHQILIPITLKSLIFHWLLTKKETLDHPMKTNTQSLIDRFSQVQVSPDVRGYVCREWSQ